MSEGYSTNCQQHFGPMDWAVTVHAWSVEA